MPHCRRRGRPLRRPCRPVRPLFLIVSARGQTTRSPSPSGGASCHPHLPERADGQSEAPSRPRVRQTQNGSSPPDRSCPLPPGEAEPCERQAVACCVGQGIPLRGKSPQGDAFPPAYGAGVRPRLAPVSWARGASRQRSSLASTGSPPCARGTPLTVGHAFRLDCFLGIAFRKDDNERGILCGRFRFDGLRPSHLVVARRGEARRRDRTAASRISPREAALYPEGNMCSAYIPTTSSETERGSTDGLPFSAWCHRVVSQAGGRPERVPSVRLLIATGARRGSIGAGLAGELSAAAGGLPSWFARGGRLLARRCGTTDDGTGGRAKRESAGGATAGESDFRASNFFEPRISNRCRVERGGDSRRRPTEARRRKRSRTPRGLHMNQYDTVVSYKTRKIVERQSEVVNHRAGRQAPNVIRIHPHHNILDFLPASIRKSEQIFIICEYSDYPSKSHILYRKTLLPMCPAPVRNAASPPHRGGQPAPTPPPWRYGGSVRLAVRYDESPMRDAPGQTRRRGGIVLPRPVGRPARARRGRMGRRATASGHDFLRGRRMACAACDFAESLLRHPGNGRDDSHLPRQLP